MSKCARSLTTWLAVAAAMCAPLVAAAGGRGGGGQDARLVLVPEGGACASAPVSYWWNVGWGSYPDLAQYDIVAADQTQTGGGCTTPGCTRWSMGLWPTIDSSGNPHNGGVPQAANLTAHVAALRETVVKWIPDPDWAGNAVFDFESWTPIWEQNDNPSGYWHSDAYQIYSKKLVQEAHPTWNESQVATEAQAQFEAAALNFFVVTLNTCKELRPKAKWGYYGFPQNHYGLCLNLTGTITCGYGNPITGPIYRAQNDRLKALWDATTGMYPSIYIPPYTFPADNAVYVRETTAEGVRCASPGVPTRPFMWSYYHNGTTHLSEHDLFSSVSVPGAVAGYVDGVVIWGDPREHAADFYAYLKSSLGPQCLSYTQKQCSCGASQCSGHGRCIDDFTKCACTPPYTGADCSATE